MPTNEDEGILISGAIRILDGEVPYRDFWHITLPGVIWLLSIFFKIFGATHLNERIIALVFIIAQGVVIYMIASKFTHKPIYPLLSATIFYLFNIIPSVALTPHKPAMLFALMSFYLFLNHHYISAGVSASFSLFMQQNIGVTAFLGIVSISALDSYLEHNEFSWKRTFLYSVSFLAPVFVFFIYLFITDAYKEALYTLFVWPFKGYRTFNRYPFFNCEFEILRTAFNPREPLHPLTRVTAIGTLIFTGFLPPVLFLAHIIHALVEKNHGNLKITLFGIFLFLNALIRPDFLHIIYALPVFFIILFIPLSQSKIILKTFYVFFITIMLILVFSERCLAFLNVYSIKYREIVTERGTIKVQEPMANELLALINIVKEYTSSTDRIFIYHWSPSLYFYLNRKNPARFDTYKPIYNSMEQLMEITDSLKQNKPALIIRDNYIERIIDPRLPSSLSCTFPAVNREELKNDPVDEYIVNNFRLIYKVGGFKIFKF